MLEHAAPSSLLPAIYHAAQNKTDWDMLPRLRPFCLQASTTCQDLSSRQDMLLDYNHGNCSSLTYHVTTVYATRPALLSHDCRVRYVPCAGFMCVQSHQLGGGGSGDGESEEVRQRRSEDLVGLLGLRRGLFSEHWQLYVKHMNWNAMLVGGQGGYISRNEDIRWKCRHWSVNKGTLLTIEHKEIKCTYFAFALVFEHILSNESSLGLALKSLLAHIWCKGGRDCIYIYIYIGAIKIADFWTFLF